jgi:hypothetical protein
MMMVRDRRAGTQSNEKNVLTFWTFHIPRDFYFFVFL